jgi:hypothetical protein
MVSKGGNMQAVTISAFKAMSSEEVKAGQCLKVTSDGEMAYYVIVKPVGEMTARIEAIASQIDASRGF